MDANWMAILSAGSGGAAALLARRFMNFTNSRNLVSLNFGLLFLMMLPAAPFFWHFELTWQAGSLFLITAMVDAAANYFYFKSFESLQAVTASAILALSPLAALAVQLLTGDGFHLGWINAGGILCVVAGLVLLAQRKYPDERVDFGKDFSLWYLAYPAAAAVLFGVNVFPTRTLMVSGWTNPYTYYWLRSLVVAVTTGLILRPNLSWLTRQRTAGLAGRLVFVIAQWLLLLTALERGNPAVVKALADTSPLFVLILSAFVLSEKPSLQQGIGVLLTGIGIVLIT
jgi:drug/metabolite transporter (DMT)-like permease